MTGKLVVFSGAGLSADSGLKTFRDSGGLWEGHDPVAVASASTWKTNFVLVHRFYSARRLQLAEAQPNAAHYLLAEWQKRYDMANITQNVDDLLERAGCTEVMHVHGHLTALKCVACGHEWDVGYTAWGPEDRCPKCNSLKGVRPGVVMFGDVAPLYRKMWRTFDDLKQEDLLVVIGTAGAVVDIGAVAALALCPSILSNLDSGDAVWTPGVGGIEDRQFTHVLHGRAAEMAPVLDAKVREILG